MGTICCFRCIGHPYKCNAAMLQSHLVLSSSFLLIPRSFCSPQKQFCFSAPMTTRTFYEEQMFVKYATAKHYSVYTQFLAACGTVRARLQFIHFRCSFQILARQDIRLCSTNQLCFRLSFVCLYLLRTRKDIPQGTIRLSTFQVLLGMSSPDPFLQRLFGFGFGSEHPLAKAFIFNQPYKMR